MGGGVPLSSLEEGLNQLLTRSRRQDVTCTFEKELFPGKTRSRGIRYTLFRDDEGKEYFVKDAPRIRLNDALERNLWRVKGVITPEYFGWGRVGNQMVAAWAYTHGRHLNSFMDIADEQLDRLLDSMVAVNRATRLVRSRVPNILVDTALARPLAERLYETVKRLNAPELLDGTGNLARIESATLERLKALGNRFLNHCDVAPHNIIVDQQGRLVVVDWESAAITVPGACLRRLAEFPEPKQRNIADAFSQKLAVNDVAASDAYFVMGALNAFGKLINAINAGSVTHLRDALVQLPFLVESRL